MVRSRASKSESHLVRAAPPPSPFRRFALAAIAPLAGAAYAFAFELAWFDGVVERESSAMVLLRLVTAAVAGGALFAMVRRWLGQALLRLLRDQPFEPQGVLTVHALGYLPLLGHAVLLWFYELGAEATWAAGLLMVAVHLAGVVPALTPDRRRGFLVSRTWLAVLFFLSGLAALVYQVTWQRSLFTAFGINIESITVVVTLFMLGLGLGSLLGGALSRRAPERIPFLFMACEVAIGAFGVVSLPLIRATGAWAAGWGTAGTIAALFTLLLPPTMLMGATLPLLVEYLDATWRHVGRTVGMLYFVNTLGSACACFLTADLLFVFSGQQLAVVFAAACNVTVGVLVYRSLRGAAAPEAAS
ncbi:MAG: hypothetical protein K1X89_08255 [Myxococcaceae bacterium]|nr:hypothetical protein [Myxococcaceae bacterium]